MTSYNTICLRSVNILVVLLVFSLVVTASKGKCEICTTLVDKFFEGLKTTAKSNFGGGNTHWEEKSLGSYAFSEIRFVEILDNVCDDNGCHSMVEEYEEAIEQWWFKHYAKKKDTKLHTYLCIDRVSGACCPAGKWGAGCSICPGFEHDLVCKGNGECDGNGTREGTGECECADGYTGDLCDECEEGYFEESRNETTTKCEACHEGCHGGCTGAGALACTECKEEGWTFDETQGCIDINECDQETNPCEETEYCTNNEGSYQCISCHKACQGCTSGSADECVTCAEGYYKDGDMCKGCHISCSATCTGGSAKDCDSCKEGWQRNEENSCTDINECTDNPCSETQYCVNSPGSHKCKECDAACDGCTAHGSKHCKTCAKGYTLNDKRCADINECEAVGACPEDERCENLIGSHACHCKDGFARKDGTCIQKEEKKKKKEIKANGPYKGPADCTTCKDIVKNMQKGIEETSKSNFGGGNTKWEEQKLGAYVHSETRLAEVTEHACPDNEKKCSHMLERYEETLEKWWFKHFAHDKNLDLYTWFCIEKAQVCCADGTYGDKCTPCPGTTDKICSSRGKCDGEGTRKGTGKCKCDKGYTQDLCNECDNSYYKASKDYEPLECKVCDAVCGESGCFAEGAQGCEDCIKGYDFDEDNDTGCHDIDECASESSPCKDGQTCINNPGSYKCVRCDRSCAGCTDSGPTHCIECAEKFFNDTDRCRACDRACKSKCSGPTKADCIGACKKGYEMKEDEGCVDIDECATEQFHCRGNTYCANTHGHYQCKRCDKACVDKCSSGGPSGCHECKAGYDKLEEGGCTDIDECSTECHDCTSEHQTCVNVLGSFVCGCEEGFKKEPGGCAPDDTQNEEKEQETENTHTKPNIARDDLLHPKIKESLDLKNEDLIPPEVNDDEYVTMEGGFHDNLADDTNKDEL